MKQFFITMLAVLTALFLALLVLPLGLALMFGGGPAPLPKSMVLTLDLNRPLGEAPSRDPLAMALGKAPLAITDIVVALDRAGRDKRVKGLYLDLGGGGLGVAQAQELRDAVKGFRGQGKFALAYSSSFLSPGMGDYYAAAASDEIWLQPSGDFNPAGMSIVTPFFRDGLDKLGVKANFGARQEYKSAFNSATEQDYTAPQRESLERILESALEVVVRDIAADRNLSQDQVLAAINTSPHSAAEVLEAGLVDRLAYASETRARIDAKLGEDVEPVTIGEYIDSAGPPDPDAETIALVYGAGMIMPGESDHSRGPVGENIVGGDTLAQALEDAADDPDVKGILLRIASPGGSYTASDQIWHAVARAREAGVPIVASFGAVAASGGYFVAMGADRIIAQPATLTGSIGVLSGKLVVGGLTDKLGINLAELSLGDNALMYSTQRGFTPAQWDSLNRGLDRVYADFTAKVGAGRGLSAEQVKASARGRVWTGSDALGHGLVDELGGFGVAVARLKELAGIAADVPVELRVYPVPESLAEQLIGLASDLGGGQQARALRELAMAFEPLADTLDLLTATPAGAGVLAMPIPMILR